MCSISFADSFSLVKPLFFRVRPFTRSPVRAFVRSLVRAFARFVRFFFDTGQILIKGLAGKI